MEKLDKTLPWDLLGRLIFRAVRESKDFRAALDRCQQKELFGRVLVKVIAEFTFRFLSPKDDKLGLFLLGIYLQLNEGIPEISNDDLRRSTQNIIKKNCFGKWKFLQNNLSQEEIQDLLDEVNTATVALIRRDAEKEVPKLFEIIPYFKGFLEKYKIQNFKEFIKQVKDHRSRIKEKEIKKYWDEVEVALFKELKRAIAKWSPFLVYTPRVIYTQKVVKVFFKILREYEHKESIKIRRVDLTDTTPDSNGEETEASRQLRWSVEAAVEGLSKKGREIARLLMDKETPTAISRQLHISVLEVDRVMSELRGKLFLFRYPNAKKDTNKAVPTVLKTKQPVEENAKIFGYKKSENYRFIVLIGLFSKATTIRAESSESRIPRSTFYRLLKRQLPQHGNVLLIPKEKISSPYSPLKGRIKYFMASGKIDFLRKTWREKNNRNYKEWLKLVANKKNVSDTAVRWWLHRLKTKLNLPNNYFRTETPSERKCRILFKEYNARKFLVKS